MDKIIGNWRYIIFCLITLSIQAGMNLRMLDSKGVPLKTAGLGQPFTLEVSITDVSSFSQYPKIKGIERFAVKNSGMRIATVNGRTNATYTYEVRIDQPDTYIIGPAMLEVNGQRFSSNTLAVKVADAAEAQTTLPKKVRDQESQTFMRLTTDKQHAVVGERIGCSLRFYFDDPRVMLKQLIMQESKRVTRTPLRGPFTGTEVIDGTSYHYAEWQWDSYADASGNVTIPAYGVDYEREIQDNRNSWSGFARFFGNQVERKRIYSNAVTVYVSPLPTTQEVQGVGNFSYIHMSAQPAIARQAEGIVLTVEIAGDGNMHALTMPTLQNMPEQLKYYESKQTLIEPNESRDLYKKRFEFVLQGLKTGNWEIPAQSFTYYDVTQRKVRTISSSPLTITIMAAAAQASPFFDDKPQTKPIAGLHENGPWHPAKPGWQFEWWMIPLLFFAPIALLIIRGMMMHFKRRVTIPYEIIRERTAFSYAHKQFAKLKAQRDARRLYSMFIELMANKYKTSLGSITLPFIMLRLKQASLSEQQLEQWQQFFTIITEHAYSGTHTDIDEKLFKQAEQWLNDLQKVL